MRHEDSLDWSGSGRGGEKWSDPGYTLKVVLSGFSDGFDVGCKRK